MSLVPTTSVSGRHMLRVLRQIADGWQLLCRQEEAYWEAVRCVGVSFDDYDFGHPGEQTPDFEALVSEAVQFIKMAVLDEALTFSYPPHIALAHLSKGALRLTYLSEEANIVMRQLNSLDWKSFNRDVLLGMVSHFPGVRAYGVGAAFRNNKLDLKVLQSYRARLVEAIVAGLCG